MSLESWGKEAMAPNLGARFPDFHHFMYIFFVATGSLVGRSRKRSIYLQNAENRSLDDILRKQPQSISKQTPKIHPRCDREENSEEIFEDWKCIFCSRPKIFGCSIYALEVERLLVYWEGGFVCPAQVGWLRHAWGSCIIHCNQLEEEHMRCGAF